jgi:hypothetical protein
VADDEERVDRRTIALAANEQRRCPYRYRVRWCPDPNLACIIRLTQSVNWSAVEQSSEESDEERSPGYC